MNPNEADWRPTAALRRVARVPPENVSRPGKHSAAGARQGASVLVAQMTLGFEWGAISGTEFSHSAGSCCLRSACVRAETASLISRARARAYFAANYSNDRCPARGPTCCPSPRVTRRSGPVFFVRQLIEIGRSRCAAKIKRALYASLIPRTQTIGAERGRHPLATLIEDARRAISRESLFPFSRFNHARQFGKSRAAHFVAGPSLVCIARAHARGERTTAPRRSRRFCGEGGRSLRAAPNPRIQVTTAKWGGVRLGTNARSMTSSSEPVTKRRLCFLSGYNESPSVTCGCALLAP